MRVVCAALAASVALLGADAQAQDVMAGRTTFAARCGVCHGIAAARSSPMAPSLKGVVGRRVAALPDFAYTAALKAKGGAWTPRALDAFLASPMRVVPGSRMMTAVPDPADRANLIAYLKTAK